MINRGEAWTCLASVYEARRDLAGARDALEHALACYEPKEYLIDGARIRKRLARLVG